MIPLQCANQIVLTHHKLSFIELSMNTRKLRPKAKMSLIIRLKYSFTLASNCIGKAPFPPIDSNDKKNLIAKGIIR